MMRKTTILSLLALPSVLMGTNTHWSEKTGECRGLYHDLCHDEFISAGICGVVELFDEFVTVDNANDQGRLRTRIQRDLEAVLSAVHSDCGRCRYSLRLNEFEADCEERNRPGPAPEPATIAPPAPATQTPPAPTTQRVTGCYERGIDLEGNDIGANFQVELGLRAASQCQAKCAEVEECLFWTVEKDTGFCRLKSDDSGRQPAESDNVVSGPAWCPESSVGEKPPKAGLVGLIVGLSAGAICLIGIAVLVIVACCCKQSQGVGSVQTVIPPSNEQEPAGSTEYTASHV